MERGAHRMSSEEEARPEDMVGRSLMKTAQKILGRYGQVSAYI
jgi:hypothetical protein